MEVTPGALKVGEGGREEFVVSTKSRVETP